MFFRDGSARRFTVLFPSNISNGPMSVVRTDHVQLNDFVLPYFGSELTFESGNAVFDMVGCDFNMEPHRRQLRGRRVFQQCCSVARNKHDSALLRQCARSGNRTVLGRDRALRLSRHLTPVGFRRDKTASSSRWQLPEFSRVRCAACAPGEIALRYAQDVSHVGFLSHVKRSRYLVTFLATACNIQWSCRGRRRSQER